MSIYGYIRELNLIDINDQLKALSSFNCDQLFVENTILEDNYELTKLLQSVKVGDTLVIYKTQVLISDMEEFNQVLKKLIELDLTLICVSEESVELKFLYFYSKLLSDMMASYQNDTIKKRLAEARENGVILGRPSINAEKAERIRFLFQSKRLTMRTIASMCNVSLGTVHKYVNEKPND